MIFETNRLRVRKLKFSDIEPFHELQSSVKVMQYATGNVRTLIENKKNLKELIDRYTHSTNDFWIYAIEEKKNNQFIGTVALVKDESHDDEIGYRFIEKYWGLGYGKEVCKGLVLYCKAQGFKKLIGYVVDKNIASAKILERLGFKAINHFISEDIKLPVTKYQLILC